MKKCEQGNGGHFKWAAVIIVRFGVAQDPGSARVSRVGFGVSPKRSSRKVRDCEMRALPGIQVHRV